MPPIQTISCSGPLYYSSHWVVVNLGRDFIDYYWWMIPPARRYGLNKPLYPGHITVVRWKYETPSNYCYCRSGERLYFKYSPTIREDRLYLYLEVWSQDIGDVREALGLPRFIPNRNNYHITIANKKK